MESAVVTSTSKNSGILDTIQQFASLPRMAVPSAIQVDVCNADRSKGFVSSFAWNWIAPGTTLVFLFITSAIWYHNHKTALRDDKEEAADIWKQTSTTLFYWAITNLIAYLLIVFFQRYYGGKK